MEIQTLRDKFNQLLGDGEQPEVFFAPGRVNLIGEHTDYNGGHVFPCALSLGTYGLARRRQDREIHLYSENFGTDGVIVSSLDALSPSAKNEWPDYPKGVIWAFIKSGYRIDFGMDILFYGTIPNGAGLSSSASIEVLTGLIVRELCGLNHISMEKLALLGQYAENKFNGMNCGIMDQFASAMGKKGHAIYLNTSTLQHKLIPLPLKDISLIITNSKVKHSLVSSSYNDRRRECEKALARLQQMIDINTLCELTTLQYERYKELIPDETLRRRVRHAVYENRRTLEALEALEEKNIEEFGRLMNKSHLSLRDDYEVSCEEIDLLVKTAWEVPGVLGSRITGGGFGGCTVSLVKTRNKHLFMDKLTAVYETKYNITPEFYEAEIGDGAKKLLESA